ncbi:MAG: UdgX family uracil-DNA binding protein [bacterium]
MARTVYPTAAGFVPDSSALPDLAAAAQGCEGCNLYADATQAVFGAGRAGARLLLVGEQPGDVEDRRGQPFVGPAGVLLNRALDDAGIDRDAAYVTNAVKHFRWKPPAGGTRRLHQKPDAAHVSACRPWLAAELRAVEPYLVVALGATAAQSLFGPQFRVTQERGAVLSWPPTVGPFAGVQVADTLSSALATIHPSAVLRAEPGERDAMYDGFVADLRTAAGVLAGADR